MFEMIIPIYNPYTRLNWRKNRHHLLPMSICLSVPGDLISVIHMAALWEHQAIKPFACATEHHMKTSWHGIDFCTWWRHQMETFSALLPYCAGNSPVPRKRQWRGALMYSLICAWTNSWVNIRDAGNLRRHRAHYAVTVMINGLFAGTPLHRRIVSQGPLQQRFDCFLCCEWEQTVKQTIELPVNWHSPRYNGMMSS